MERNCLFAFLIKLKLKKSPDPVRPLKKIAKLSTVAKSTVAISSAIKKINKVSIKPKDLVTTWDCKKNKSHATSDNIITPNTDWEKLDR
jgi:hypothetical protein